MIFRLFLLACLAMLATGAQAVTYANKSIPFNWINTSAHAHVGYNTVPYKMNGTIAPGTGCGTTPPILDDTISDAIPIGFNFNYGGTVFTSARIMSNGRLQFNNTACGYGSPVTQLPYVYYNSATNNLNYSMRIYGNDLDPTPQANARYSTACKLTSTCYMSYATIGTAPNRQFVVTWNNIPEWAAGGSTSGNYNLQIILNEADGSFIYQYGSNTPGPQAKLAQVGWQVSQTDYDVPNVGLPVNNSAILFYIPNPIAQYHFQQSAWTTSGQVLDTSGSSPAYNGTALGGATPGVGYVCNGAVIPNNTSTATINAIDTGIPVPTALGGVGTIDFWYKANAKWKGGGDVQLLDATTVNNQWFFVVKSNNGRMRFVIRDSTGRLRVAQTPVNNIPAGTWTHIAVTWNFNALAGSNQDHMSVYINGVQTVLSRFTTSGTVSSSIGTLYLGDNRSSYTGSNGTGNSANGTLDEVNIYNFEGGTGLVQRDMNYTASCGPDHLVIQSSGAGLTCAASTLTVAACQNAACTTAYIGGITGTLSAAGTPTVNWNGSTGGATGSGFIIPSGSSSVTKNMQVVTATTGTVSFGVTAATPTPTNPTTCNFGTNSPANNNCVFTANTAGFIISNNSTGNNYTIPPQVSGIAATGLYLRALQASTNNPAVCTPAIISQTTAVNMGYTCNNPTTCQAGNLATINATAIAPGTPGSTPVSLTFDANGSALVTARYDDVGQITLNANTTVTPFSGATPVTLNGISNAYVVAPHHFVFSGVTAAPIKAGNNFSATVTAYNGLATPTATPSFGKESPSQGVTLTQTLVQPTGAGASAGSLTTPSFTPYSGGASTATINWSEVGIITLTATNNNYLGSGLSTSGTSANIGPFTPDHFDTAIINGCLSCGFTYSGEPFSVYITAMNGLSIPSITVNYDGTANTSPNFAKAVTLSAWDVPTGASQNPGPGSLLPPGNTAVALTAFTQGMASLSTVATMPFYSFTTTPTIPTSIRVRATDSDSITSLRSPLSSSIEGQPEIRSGRILISNAYGSELLQLPIAMTAQYWNASSYYDTSTTDNSTSFVVATPTAPSVVNFGNYKLNLSAISVVGSPKTVTLSSGVGGFTLAAPGAGKNGSVDMSIPAVTGTNCYVSPVPLGCYLPSNKARATFGIYKGSDHIIYMRENY